MAYTVDTDGALRRGNRTVDLALLILAIVAAVIIFAIARVNLMLFVIFGSLTTLTGLGIMASDGSAEWYTFWHFGLCMVALSAGYSVFPTHAPRLNRSALTSGDNAPGNVCLIPDPVVMGVVFVTAMFAFYHLIVGGIPLFADAIEVARFDFTSSGFFGIPGRMYLYGVPLAWVFATTVAHFKKTPWMKYKPWIWATSFYMLISLLSGFKSGLVAAFMLMLIFGIAISGKKLSLKFLIVRYWWVMIPPVAYGLLVAASYDTYQTSALPVWRQIVDRVTLIGAQPKQLAIEHQVSGAQSGAIWNDFVYFMTKYSSGDISGLYSFERAVSAQIIGVNPASSAWTTPVTVGGIPEFIFSFGTTLSVVLFFIVGSCIKYLHRPARGPYGAIWNCAVLYILYSWLIKGGLAYYMINILAVTLMLAILYVALSALMPRGQKDYKPMVVPQVVHHRHSSHKHFIGQPSSSTYNRIVG